MQMYSNPNHSDTGAVNNSETSECIDTVEPLVFRGNLGVFRYISISDDVKIKANMILKSCRILSLLLMFRNAKTAPMQMYLTTI